MGTGSLMLCPSQVPLWRGKSWRKGGREEDVPRWRSWICVGTCSGTVCASSGLPAWTLASQDHPVLTYISSRSHLCLKINTVNRRDSLFESIESLFSFQSGEIGTISCSCWYSNYVFRVFYQGPLKKNIIVTS